MGGYLGTKLVWRKLNFRGPPGTYTYCDSNPPRIELLFTKAGLINVVVYPGIIYLFDRIPEYV